MASTPGTVASSKSQVMSQTTSGCPSTLLTPPLRRKYPLEMSPDHCGGVRVAPSHLVPPSHCPTVPPPAPPHARCSHPFSLKAPGCFILVNPKYLATTIHRIGAAATGWSGERHRPCPRLQVCGGSQDTVLGEDHEFGGFLGVPSHV